MKIGELAKATGLKVQTLRYYETEGVLSTHQRTESGYRIFGPSDLERLEFIKKAKRLGLYLTEIKDILSIQEQQQPTCGHVRSLLEAKVTEVNQALLELQEFRTELVGLLEQSGGLEDCRPSGGRICGIIEGASISAKPVVLDRMRRRAPR